MDILSVERAGRTMNIREMLLLKLCKQYDQDAEDSIRWAVNELESQMGPYSIADFMIGHWLCEFMLGGNDDPEWHGTQAKYCLSLIVGDDWVLDNYWFDDDISKDIYDEFILKINDICRATGKTLIRKEKSNEYGTN